jgi:tubulin polyglutamylase TTLL6/13
MDFKLTDDENADWDLFWSDTGVQLDRISKLRPYQRINNSPGIQSLSRKNNLARNLMRLNRIFKDEYDFFPKTWVLPSESKELKAQFNRKKTKTFIIKPVNMC